jgi:hypothetical protein
MRIMMMMATVASWNSLLKKITDSDVPCGKITYKNIVTDQLKCIAGNFKECCYV